MLLCLTDTVDFPVAFLGAIHAAIGPVPFNTLLTADDYAWIVQDSAADAEGLIKPRAHMFKGELPKTATGKIQRFRLRDL